MPGLVRKILIFAAIDGLILQPAPPRSQPPATQQAIKIDYNGNVAPLLKDRRDENTTSAHVEAHGLVGLFKVASTSFLITIASREQVAQIRGRPIYCITDVSIIPLSSQDEANKAITEARKQLDRVAKRKAGPEAATEDEVVEDNASVTDDLTVDGSIPGALPDEDAHKKDSNAAHDEFPKKGLFGRFTQGWFSKRAEKASGEKEQEEEDLSKINKETKPEDALPADEKVQEGGEGDKPGDNVDFGSQSGAGPTVKPEKAAEAVADPQSALMKSLLPKILRTTKLYLASKSFFFSYDYDISHGLAKQPSHSSSLSLHQQFDPLFLWNYHLLKPLADAGQEDFVLPLLQGFVGQRLFTVDVSGDSADTLVKATSKPSEIAAAQETALDPANFKSENLSAATDATKGQKTFLLTLISRRSVKRAGLRYLRRGVDDEGNVANSVETEQILSTPLWDAMDDKVYSFMQYRGSIPLFFSQSPYSFKPLPEFWGSDDTNQAAFRKHFAFLNARYGGVQVASLVDKHGTEVSIGERYEQHAKIMNNEGGIDGKGRKLGFEWFDFHTACKGMKFENVAVLMDTLGPILSQQGWTVQRNEDFLSTQSGVLRTNCMDCLDRTNVVQSACARNALEQQLADQHITIDLQTDPRTAWFNTLWADNGDAISKQYSGTAALKGDFTRTRHRSTRGALTDFTLTLTRYYNNIVNDYFAQALIDFLLGGATEQVFVEFEADMKSQDHFIDLSRVRQSAIERCSQIVIESSDEHRVDGWTLSAPAQSNTTRTFPFEECVLLATKQALYFCRFDWGTEKVREYERIALTDLESIEKGVYITNTLAATHTDEKKNVGFLLRYTREGDNTARVNTRSLANEKDADQEGAAPGDITAKKEEEGVAAADMASQEEDTHERHSEDEYSTAGDTQPVSKEARILAFKAITTSTSSPSASKTEVDTMNGIVFKIAELSDAKVEEKDVISLVEARRMTGYLESLGYSMKKLVWG